VRKALQDNAHEPAFIQTIPRLGFKFIAEVEDLASDTEALQGVNIPAVAPGNQVGTGTAGTGRSKSSFFFTVLSPRLRMTLVAILLLGLMLAVGFMLIGKRQEPFDSVAILPFINLSGEAEQDYFADGMTEALISNLGKIKALRVISRTSVMTYKKARKPLPEIARELDVNAIVEGSVLRAGDRVRITVTLIDAATDRHLWVESYERDIHDILTLQGELARAIATEVQVELTPREHSNVMAAHPVNPRAYGAYLKGRYFWNMRTPKGFEKAERQFLTSIGHDPGYAPAYVGLADTYYLQANYGLIPSDEATAKAKKYLTRALKLDDALSEAHVALAVNLSQEWDWRGAREEFDRAIKLNPGYATAHHFYALYLTTQRRQAEALVEIKRAQELDPLSPIIITHTGWIYYCQGEYDKAIAECRKALELAPHFSAAYLWMGMTYTQKAMFEEAAASLNNMLPTWSGNTRRLSLLGHIYALAGQRSKALAILEKIMATASEDDDVAYDVALIHLGLNNKEKALDWLDRAYEGRNAMLAWTNVMPIFDSLRAEPRFKDLSMRLGF